MKLLLLALCILFAFPSFAKDLLLNTDEGPVVAIESSNSIVVPNIPYASPPTNELRWRAPRAPEQRNTAWDGRKLGVVRCAQVGGPIAASDLKDFGKPVGSEDCLYLNITIPKDGAKNKPVFFWIHGGSNTAGYAQDEMYEATKLAEKTDSIVVTVNYRLSHFGGLHHPALQNDNPEDSSGNFATLDLIQALKWVKSNIKNFGGDPDRITAAGESAGCINVWGLILSPLAENLFQQAFCASGFPLLASQEAGKNAANEFIEEVLVFKGLSKKNEASTRRKLMSNAEIKELLYSLTTAEILSLKVPAIPIQYVSDGHVFPAGNVTSLLSLGRFHKVPMMIGATKNEGTWFALKDYFSSKDLWRLINGQKSTEDLDKLMSSPQFSQFRRKSRLLTQSFRAAIGYASQIVHHYPSVPIYRYDFEWTAQTSPWQKLLGSAHAYDLALLFNKTEFKNDHFMAYLEPTLLTNESQEVSNQFLASLKGFLHEGNPNALSDTHWPRWHPLFQFYWPWKMHITNKGMCAKPGSMAFGAMKGSVDALKYFYSRACTKLLGGD